MNFAVTAAHTLKGVDELGYTTEGAEPFTLPMKQVRPAGASNAGTADPPHMERGAAVGGALAVVVGAAPRDGVSMGVVAPRDGVSVGVGVGVEGWPPLEPVTGSGATGEPKQESLLLPPGA